VDSVGEMLMCSGLFSFAGILVFIKFLLWKNVAASCGPVRKGGGVKNMGEGAKSVGLTLVRF
jgi:hypothetical protein